ncbi:hypothetical protein D3C87_1580070 [compost metagenome]
MGVDEGGRQLVQEAAPHIQQAGAARAAQGFAAHAAEHVAADVGHINRQLAKRLRRIHKIGNAGLARDAADGGGRVDQAAVGR